MCREFAQAMRKVDPTIRLIASGMHGVHGKWPLSGTQAWTERILSLAGNAFDAYSYHEYIEHLDQISRTAVAPLTLSRGGLEDLRATINRLSTSLRPQTIFFDEWNLWDAWNRTPGIQEALSAAMTLHLLCREANRLGVEGACYFQPVNEGAIRVLATTAELTPVGRVFSMLTTHAGRLPVKASGDMGPCDIFASLSSDGRSLIVTAINAEDRSSRVSFQIAATSVESVGAATAYAAQSSVASSDVVRSVIEVVRSDERRYSGELPALSFGQVEFRLAK
jgi:alpha-L-arabinofuranosidase